MAVIRDANDQPIFDDVAGNGTLGALNAEVDLALTGQSSAVFHVQSIGSQTISFEGSVDGTNYFALAGKRDDGPREPSTQAIGVWHFNTAGLANIRARCSSYTGGSAAVQAKAGQGVPPDLGRSQGAAPATQNATASGETAVAGVPAPGAGVSNYVRRACLSNQGGSAVRVELRDGTGGTAYFRATLAASGGMAYADFGEHGWKMTANTQLYLWLSAAGDVDLNVTDFYAGA